MNKNDLFSASLGYRDVVSIRHPWLLDSLRALTGPAIPAGSTLSVSVAHQLKILATQDYLFRSKHVVFLEKAIYFFRLLVDRIVEVFDF